jgi:hypothetical protein
MTGVTFVGFVVLHAATALMAPKFISACSSYFLLNETGLNSSVEVSLLLSALSSNPGTLTVNCSFVRISACGSLQMSVISDLFVVCSRHSLITRSFDFPRSTFQIHFPGDSHNSSSFSILTQSVTDSDMAEILFTFTGNFSGISGVLFSGSFVDPSPVWFAKAGRFLMSLIIVSTFFVFMSSPYSSTVSRHHTLFLLLAFSGFFASNPIFAFLQDDWRAPRFSDHFWLSFYLAVFRVFSLVELRMIRESGKGFFLVLLVFGALFVYVDSETGFARSVAVSTSDVERLILLQSDRVLLGIDLCYTLLLLALIWLNVCQSNGALNPKAALVIIFSVTDLVSIWISKVLQFAFAGFSFTIMPMVLHAAPAMTAGAFLLRTGSGPDDQRIGFTPDPISSGDGLASHIEFDADG